MPSLKRKSNFEEDFSCHMNRVTRKTKKTRLSQNGFTENVNTLGEDVTLPVYKSDEANDSELITQKFHQIKLVKDNRNAEISRAPYDSNGSVWNILEKADVTKSCTDEDILGMKKVHKNRKSKTNRGRVDEEVKVTSLISVQSSEVNDVKEVISSNRNDNNENKAQPKVKKKHKLKNKFNQSEICCTIEDDMPLVFDREKLKKNEVQNIENTVESEQNGGITNQMQVEEERQRQVELERGKNSRNVKKNKKNKTLPNTENKDVSDEYEKNDVINEVYVVKKENVRMVNEEFDVTEAETENGNVREQKRSKKKKQKSKRNSTENCDVCEKNDMISEVSVVKEQNVRMVNEEFDVREAEAQNGNVTEQKRSKKKKRKSKRNSTDNSDECEKNMINVCIVKEQNVRFVNEEFDVREAETQNGNVTEQNRSKKKKRKSKRNSTENSDEWEKDMINEVSIVKEQNVRTVNEEFDIMAAETQNENLTEQKRSKKKKRKSKRNSTKSSNEWENNMINEVSIVEEQNVRTVNEEFDLREVPTDNGNVPEEKSKKKKRNSTANSDECEKNDMINGVSIVNEQNVRVVSEECYVKEAKGVMGNVTEQTKSEKKKRKSKRHSTENREECEKNDVINEVNFLKMQKARIENREFEVMEAETDNDNVTEQKRIKKKKRKSKMLSTENSDECEKNNVINEVSIIKEQNVRMVNEKLDVKEAEGENGNVTEQKKKEKKKLKSKRRSTDNSSEAGNVMMEYTKVIDKENEELIAEDKIREKKLGKVENARERMITKLSNERKSELVKGEWEQVSKENFGSSRKKLLAELVEDELQIIHVEEMFQGNERVVENRGGKVERERKKKLKRLKSRAKQNTNMENVSYDPLSREVADIDGNNIEQNNENETIGRIKKKVTKLSIDSEEEEFENVDGKASGELVINSDMNKHWCIEDDSEEDEEDKNFIVDDNYVSYDENATSDEEYEDSECSSDDDSGSDDNEDCTEEEEEEEEEKLQCLSARQRKKRMALQFFDMEAEEGEETDIEDEEEETSSEDDDSDGKDGVEGVEQFIDSEAKEEITFVRRKKKVQVIDSEEEEEEEEGKKQEKSPQAESLEKTMHIMKKLTRIMTVGVLKGKTIRKQKTIISKEIEDKEHDSEVRIRMNVKENKRPDGKRASQKREELRIQLKVGEEIREILGEDKLGKRKRRKSATDRGRGYASDSEYVEAKKPRVETNNLFQL